MINVIDVRIMDGFVIISGELDGYRYERIIQNEEWYSYTKESWIPELESIEKWIKIN